MVETMQFRDFLFPHNPHTITVRQPEGLVGHFCPGKGDVLQHLGARARTVRCQGSFFGATYTQALAQLRAFRQKTQDSRRGMLLVPGMEPLLAYLSEFAFNAQGDGKIIPYTMVFTEAVEVAL